MVLLKKIIEEVKDFGFWSNSFNNNNNGEFLKNIKRANEILELNKDKKQTGGKKKKSKKNTSIKKRKFNCL